MAVYTFYICKPDGSAPSFEVHALRSDAEAAARASRLLEERTSCSHVMVVAGEREVLTRRRAEISQARALDLAAAADALNNGRAASSRVAVIVTDPAGAVVFWNQAASRLYGWSAMEAMGQDILKVTPSVQSRRQAKSIMAALQAGEAWEGEIVLKKRSGVPFRAYVADTPVGPVAEGEGFIVGVSAPADRRSVVWQAQAEILAELRAAPQPRPSPAG